jgi:hypothetical protein
MFMYGILKQKLKPTYISYVGFKNVIIILLKLNFEIKYFQTTATLKVNKLILII